MLASTVARGDDGPTGQMPVLTQAAPQALVEQWEIRRNHGRRATIAGIVLGVLGSCAVAGMTYDLATFRKQRNTDTDFAGFPLMVLSSVFGGVATLLLSVGVPVWAHAQHKLDRLSVSVGASGQSVSAGLRWQF
jgi:hypothetical protein